ncbi:MAG: hypothetical protein RIC16_09045 [Rhodospirillales bacterium]
MQTGKHAKLAVLAVMIGLFVPASSSPASAQETGKLSAVSYMPIEQGEAFEVRALDNSAQNLELVSQMQQALRLRGRGVKDGSRLILTLEPRDVVGSGTSSQRHIMSFTGESSTGHEDSTELRFNIFDSQKGGILNEGDQPGGGVQPSQYVLLVRVEDRSNGRQLWEGWASAPLLQGDGSRLLGSMVPHLADAIGTTVSEEPITIR